jgi:hypothetical protein
MSNKKAYYFSHDANAHEDPKIIVLMSTYGTQGYGWWWLIVETLFNQEENVLDLSKVTTIPLLYRVMWDCDIKKIPSFIDFLVEIELLKRDGDKVYSPSLLNRVEKFDSIREARRKAANARWDKYRSKKEDDEEISVPFKDVESESITNNPKADKSKKVLSELESWSLFKAELKTKFPVLTDNQLENQKEMCLNWLDSTGKRKKDYKAFFRNWVRKYIDDKGLENKSSKSMVY